MNNNYKQIRTYACGVTVCRKILFLKKNLSISEDDFYKIIKNHNFSDNNWKDNFLNDCNVMPTEMLVELMGNEFQMTGEIKNEVSTNNLLPQNDLVVIEWPINQFHAILYLGLNTGDEIKYFDPASDEEFRFLKFSEFDCLRRNKSGGGYRKVVSFSNEIAKTVK